MLKQRIAHRRYDDFLSAVQRYLGDTTTTGEQLDELGRKIFKGRWKGVFSKDTVPKSRQLSRRGTQFMVVNTEPSSGSGEHWVALVSKDGRLYGYDSYGRKVKDLLGLRRNVTESDTTDREQAIRQKNCGARVMAWLILFSENVSNALVI